MSDSLFLLGEGRCLPQREEFTDLEIEQAAMRQRLSIEEQLLKLRLGQKCFLALIERCPQSVILDGDRLDGGSATGIPTSFSDGRVSLLQSGSSPALNTSELASQHGQALPTKTSLPGGVSSDLNGDRRDACPTGELPAHWREALERPRLKADEVNRFPGGRW